MDETLVTVLEDLKAAIRDRYTERWFSLREAAGERPYNYKKARDDDLARRALPAWYVYGNAHPDVAKNYWKERVSDPNREIYRWKDALQLEKKMRALYSDPKYVAYPLLYADDQQRAELTQMMAQGLHAGRTYPIPGGDDA